MKLLPLEFAVYNLILTHGILTTRVIIGVLHFLAVDQRMLYFPVCSCGKSMPMPPRANPAMPLIGLRQEYNYV
ncbi:hypothetical protein CMV_013273 [Castanea mollissima]|uniref:Uncharacterized protein n=1 Tax=Castanea mollissima TaxID=60419 RepID=A0A8J4VM26_9ROSI|nr:hypothetical protein CMV_013273 [Castanea mollissima]